MTAVILQFPQTQLSMERLALVIGTLQQAFDVPRRDAELAMLCTICDHLIASYSDEYLDSFLVRIAEWEADNARG